MDNSTPRLGDLPPAKGGACGGPAAL